MENALTERLEEGIIPEMSFEKDSRHTPFSECFATVLVAKKSIEADFEPVV